MTLAANMEADELAPPRRVRDVAPFVVTVAAIGVFSFLSGGYVIGRSSPVAIVTLLALAVWVWFLRRRSRPPVVFLVALAAFGAFVSLAGLSVLWSFGPDLSWVAFNLAALYLAVAAITGLTPVRGLQLRTAAYAFLAAAVAVAVYAFLGKAMPDVVTHARTYARLESPVGYWNVLALQAVMALVVAVALAGSRAAHPAWRIAAAASGVPLLLTFFFTFSRGGWVVLVVALVLYFALTTVRLASLASLLAMALPVAWVLWRLRGLETLFAATDDDVLRAAQGATLLRWSLAALAIAAGAQAVIAFAQRRVPWPHWLRLTAGGLVLVVLVAGVVGGSWRYLDQRGGTAWLEERARTFLADSDEISSADMAGRLISLNTGRPPLWREAFEQSRYQRALGTGAGTFPFTHYRFRGEYGGVVKHAHSEWFDVLSELGIVGLSLLAAGLALFLAAAVRNPFRDRGDPLRPLVAALQAGMVAFVVHLSWDWTWDMAAIGVVFFLFAGTCASYLGTRAADRRRGERTRAETPARCPGGPASESVAGGTTEEARLHGRAGARARRGEGATWPARAVASAALLALALSWAPPLLSARAHTQALVASGGGDPGLAIERAHTAARWNPLSVDPLVTESLVLQQLGRNREARDALLRAVNLQPDNYVVHYYLGVLELRAFGRNKAAAEALKRSLALNPRDAATRFELAHALGG